MAYSHPSWAESHRLYLDAQRKADGSVVCPYCGWFEALTDNGLCQKCDRIVVYEFDDLDEEAFRFNKRFGNDAERFIRVVKQIAGKQLTYKEAAGILATDKV
jgi:hypothetical protein